MSRIGRLNPHFKPAFDGLKIATALIEKILQTNTIIEAYLFGSAAEEKNTADSDLDILLVIPDGLSSKDYYKIVTTPFFSPIAVDWIIKNETDFKKECEIGGVAMIAKHQGKRLWPNGKQ
ncbi:MAG: hypothetical protein RJB66_1551 [Pseudomonadota bacterium]|jgi:predicted nucleotidyltransferase